MARTAIATDSNSGITQSQAKELGVFVLPMPFFMRGKIQFEDIDLTQEQFYEILAEDAAVPVPLQPAGPVLQALLPAAEDGGHRGAAPEGCQHGIIPVEHQQKAETDVGQQLALGPEDVLPAAQALDVGVPDVGDDSHVRLDDLPQLVDLPRAVHPHLQHADHTAPVQPQQGQGQADVVVVIALGLEHPVPGAQHGGDHVLGGGLAHAAGDLHKGDLKPVPVGGGQIPQSQSGIRYLDVKLILPDILGQLGAQAASGAGVQRRVDEQVSVELLPHPGQKQAAGNDPPAVRGNGAHHRDLFTGIPPDPLDRRCDLCYRHWLHTLSPLDF